MKNLKQFVVLGLLVLSLSACNLNSNEPLYNLESFFPKETFVIYEVNQHSSSQVDNLNKLIAKFPEDPRELLLKEAGKDSSFSYEDIQPIVGDDFRLLFGISGDVTKDTPDMIIAFDLKNGDALEKFTKDHLEVSSSDYNGFKVLSNDEKDFYLGYKNEFAVIGNSENVLKESIDGSSGQNTLATNEKYRNFLDSIDVDRIGSIYISIQDVLGAFGEKMTTDEQNVYNLMGLDGFDYEGYAIKAEENGVRMQVYFEGDSELFHALDGIKLDPYLANLIPGKNLVGYSESSGLDVALRAYLKVAQLEINSTIENPETADVMSIEEQIKQQTGLSLEDDIFSFMDKNYAFSMQSQEGLIPGLSLVIDASSDLDGAKKFTDYLDTQIAAANVFASIALENENILSLGTVEVEGADLKSITFDAKNLPEGVMPPIGPLADLTVSLYYGVTGDGKFIVSTYKNLPADYGKEVVSKNESYNLALSKVVDGNTGKSYFSPKSLFVWLDSFVPLLELTGADTTQFKDISDIVKHFEYGAGSMNIENGKGIGELFIAIE